MEENGHTASGESEQTTPASSAQPLMMTNANTQQRARSNSQSLQDQAPPRESSRPRHLRPSSISYPNMPMPQPIHGTRTHAGGIQPPPGFFRPSRPPNAAAMRAASDLSASGVIHIREEVAMNPLGSTRFNDSKGSLSNATSEPSMQDPTPASAVDGSRRRPARLQLSREPLLPIGGGYKRPTPALTTTPSTSEFRNSFDRIFKRKSGENRRSIGATPTTKEFVSGAASPNVNPFHEGGSSSGREDGGVIQIGSSPPRTPLSPPLSPRTPRSINHQPMVPPSPNRPTVNPVLNSFLSFHHRPPAHYTGPVFPRTSVLLNSKKPKRNYHKYPSNNIFLCGGRIVTGGGASPLPFIGTVFVVLGLTGVWFGTTAAWWCRRSAGGTVLTVIGAYLTLLTLTNMFVTAFRDPGILPRDLDPDPPYPAWSSDDVTDPDNQPLPRDILIRNNIMRVKYCTTCQTYRPPRSTHCRLCDNCVDGCDHHCQWLNTCVGRRNYTSFIAVLVFGSITLIYVIVTAALHISLVPGDFREALKHSIGSAIVFVLGLVVLAPVGALLSYHISLLYHNTTTVERLRSQAVIKITKAQSQSNASLPKNPFEMRWYYNIAYLLCRPSGYDWIEANQTSTLDARTINPGTMYAYRRRAEGGYQGDEGKPERVVHHVYENSTQGHIDETEEDYKEERAVMTIEESKQIVEGDSHKPSNPADDTLQEKIG